MLLFSLKSIWGPGVAKYCLISELPFDHQSTCLKNRSVGLGHGPNQNSPVLSIPALAQTPSSFCILTKRKGRKKRACQQSCSATARSAFPCYEERLQLCPQHHCVTQSRTVPFIRGGFFLKQTILASAFSNKHQSLHSNSNHQGRGLGCT